VTTAPTTEGSGRPEIQRDQLLSLLFSLFGGPGIGQLYNGRWPKAALFCLASPPLYCLGVGLTVRLPVRFVNLIPLALPLGWGFAVAVDAVRDASRPRVVGPRPWYSHGAFCTGLALLNVFVFGPAWVGATRLTWARAYTIPTGTMEPTVLAGDHLFADTSAYGFRNPLSGAMLWRRREPTRGELIVFAFPEDRTRDFLKRVIGLPGETGFGASCPLTTSTAWRRSSITRSRLVERLRACT
jgi:hypothetical protein